MATFGPKPRDSASEYEGMYTHPENRFGVQNARAVRSNRNQTLTSRPSEDGRRKRTVPTYRGVYETSKEEITQNQYSENSSSTNYPESLPNYQNNSVAPSKQKNKVSISARARSVTFATFVSSIALFIWPFQFLIAITSFAFLGISNQTEASWLAWMADKSAQNIGWLIGFQYIDLRAMAFAGFFILFIISFFLLFGSLLAAKFMRLNPLLGNGATKKTSLFIIAMCSCAVPLFPCTIFWTWSVMLDPK